MLDLPPSIGRVTPFNYVRHDESNLIGILKLTIDESLSCDEKTDIINAKQEALNSLLKNQAQDSRLDLREANLQYLNLRGISLKNADLSYADLSYAYLNDVNLSGTDLSGANLSNAFLSDVDLKGANLSGANLSRAILKNTILSGANLSGADLGDAKLWGAKLNLSDANLSDANLRGVDLSSAKFVLAKSLSVLNRLGEYACTDASTFVDASNPSYAQIKSRLDDFGQDSTRIRADRQAGMIVNVAAGFGVDRSQLEKVAAFVDKARAGCCSTLAYAGAAELLKHAGECRVEVLAHHQGHNTTHCFIIVGRADPSDLAQVGSWGADALVVDPWAATIGNLLSGPPSRPPISNMWPPTQSLFDSRLQT